MAGVYYVAAELSKRGCTALLTTRNAKSFDVVAVNEKTGATAPIEVKTCGVSTSDSFWLLGKKDYDKRPDNFIYVFVKLYGDKLPDFYIVPAEFVAANLCEDKARTGSVWYSIPKRDIAKYKERWDSIG
jgi:hypothetical protein